MSDTANLGRGVLSNDAYYILWLAIAAAALFVGLILFDVIRRWKRNRRRFGKNERLSSAFFGNVPHVGAVKDALKDYSRERRRRQVISQNAERRHR